MPGGTGGRPRLNWSTVPVGRACLELGLFRCGLSSTRTSTTRRCTSRCSGEPRAVEPVGLGAGRQLPQGVERGLVSQCRRLAEQIGLDHSNVAQALRVAELPQEIVRCVPQPGRHSIPLGRRAGQGLPAGSGRGFCRLPVSPAGRRKAGCRGGVPRVTGQFNRRAKPR